MSATPTRQASALGALEEPHRPQEHLQSRHDGCFHGRRLARKRPVRDVLASNYPWKRLLQRQALELSDGSHDATEFGKTLEAADHRIAGMGWFADIVE